MCGQLSYFYSNNMVKNWFWNIHPLSETACPFQGRGGAGADPADTEPQNHSHLQTIKSTWRKPTNTLHTEKLWAQIPFHCGAKALNIVPTWESFDSIWAT